MFIASYASSLMSTNWHEEEFETRDEAERFTEERRKEGYVVLPVENTDEEQIIDLQTKVNLLEAENSQLQQKLSKTTENAVEEIKQLKAENNRLEEAYENSSKYTFRLEQRLEKAKEVYAEQKSAIKDLNARLEKAKEVYFAMKAEIKALKKQLEQKQ